MKLSNYLNPNLMTLIDAESRDDSLRQLAHLAYEVGELSDEEAFNRALLERESIVSTGIGMGVAIPHAKLHGFDHFFIVIGLLKKAIDWHSLDGGAVRLIFMIGGPDDKPTEYLQILSLLTHVIKDEKLRKKILAATNLTDLVELFKKT